MAFYTSFVLPVRWCRRKPQAQAPGLYVCVLPRGLTSASPGHEMRAWACRGVTCSPPPQVLEDCWQKTSFQCLSQLGRALQKKALLSRHTAGWRPADTDPRFSKRGWDWTWTSDEPQTQRSANKLIKRSWERRGQQSAETPQTPWLLRGLLRVSLLTCH